MARSAFGQTGSCASPLHRSVGEIYRAGAIFVLFGDGEESAGQGPQMACDTLSLTACEWITRNCRGTGHGVFSTKSCLGVARLHVAFASVCTGVMAFEHVWRTGEGAEGRWRAGRSAEGAVGCAIARGCRCLCMA